MFGPNLKGLMAAQENDEISIEELPSLEACLMEADDLVESEIESLEAIDWGTVAKYAITAVIVGAYITIAYRRFKKIKKVRDNLHKHAVKVMGEGGSIMGKFDPKSMSWADTFKGADEIITKAMKLSEFQYVHPLLDQDFKDDVDWSQISNWNKSDLLCASDLPAFSTDSIAVLRNVRSAVDTAVEAVRKGEGFDAAAFRLEIKLASGTHQGSTGLAWLSKLREQLTNSTTFTLDQKFKSVKILSQSKPFSDFALEAVTDTNKVLSRVADNAHSWLGDMDKASRSLNDEISSTLKMFEDLAASGADRVPDGGAGGKGLIVRGGDTIIPGDLSKQEELLDKSRKDLVKVFGSAGKYGTTVLDFTGVVAKSQLKAVLHGQREQLEVFTTIESIMATMFDAMPGKPTAAQLGAHTQIKSSIMKYKKVIKSLEKIVAQYS